MLFLIACSSIALDDSAIIRLGSDTGEPVPYPACYAACETLWVPAPECEEFYAREEEPVSVDACQAECALATGDGNRDGVVFRDEWTAALERDIPDYGCYSAAIMDGETPCAKSGACPDQ